MVLVGLAVPVGLAGCETAPHSSCVDGICRPNECSDPPVPGPCAAVVECELIDVADGTACDDGDPCTRDDACSAGVCAGTECEGASLCATTRCVPDVGCVTDVVPDGTVCEERSSCAQSSHCIDGACVPACSELCFSDVTDLLLEVRLAGAVGGGAALFDADEDGWLDLVVAGEPDVLRYFRGTAGGFEAADAGLELGEEEASPAHGGNARPLGAIAADFNRDGHDDLFVMVDGPNQLYYGRGDGTFQRGAFPSLAEYTTAAGAADVNGDGWLDLHLGNYILEVRPDVHVPAENRFYLGSEDGFVEADLGIEGAGATLAALFTDFDADGDPDLFVCNDFGADIEPNQLYRNDDGAFTEVTSREGARLAFFCMGLTASDYDRDGDRDVFVSNLGENALLRRVGDRYADVASVAGVHGAPDMCSDFKPSTSWAAMWADFDLDGWIDLYVSNGYVSYGDSAMEDPHRIYRHQGMSFTFEDVSFDSGVASVEQGRGAVFGDLDRDGDVDIVQIHSDGPPLVLRNESPRRGGWLRVELPGRIGTEVTVDLGDARLARELRRHEGYASGQPAELYFGLGDAEIVDVVARHRDGTMDSWADVEADSVLRVPAPIVE